MIGKIEVKTHYFEAGNIQVNLQKDFASQDLGAEATGEGVSKAIDKHETDYQAVLDEMHEGFKEGLFQKVRRIMPVHGQYFDWSGGKLIA